MMNFINLIQIKLFLNFLKLKKKLKIYKQIFSNFF
jgi:hypothetical protein